MREASRAGQGARRPAGGQGSGFEHPPCLSFLVPGHAAARGPGPSGLVRGLGGVPPPKRGAGQRTGRIWSGVPVLTTETPSAEALTHCRKSSFLGGGIPPLSLKASKQSRRNERLAAFELAPSSHAGPPRTRVECTWDLQGGFEFGLFGCL